MSDLQERQLSYTKILLMKLFSETNFVGNTGSSLIAEHDEVKLYKKKVQQFEITKCLFLFFPLHIICEASVINYYHA